MTYTSDQATQLPLKIGIIDSGITKEFLQHTGATVAAAARFDIDWQAKRLTIQRYDTSDLSAWLAGTQTLEIDDATGHGTAVISILHRELQLPVIYYIAKILNDNMSGSAICLTEAIDWLSSECQVDVINMSLGCDNFYWQARVQAAVDRAGSNNCLLFGAAGDIPTLPSEAEGVISIGVARHQQKRPTRIDCMALDSEITIFQQGYWTNVPISSSYACPQLLALTLNLQAKSNSKL